MKTLFIRTTLIGLLVLATAFVARAQDSRIQMGSLDHLAAKASQTVDVSIDERLIKIAAKVFSDTDIDEREVKKLLNGLKGFTSSILNLILTDNSAPRKSKRFARSFVVQDGCAW